MLNVVMLSVVMLKADSPRAKMFFFSETHLSTCAIKRWLFVLCYCKLVRLSSLATSTLFGQLKLTLEHFTLRVGS